MEATALNGYMTTLVQLVACTEFCRQQLAVLQGRSSVHAPGRRPDRGSCPWQAVDAWEGPEITRVKDPTE
jgi:hypothetical protein